MTLSDFDFSGTPLNCESTDTKDSHHLDPVCVKTCFQLKVEHFYGKCIKSEMMSNSCVALVMKEILYAVIAFKRNQDGVWSVRA